MSEVGSDETDSLYGFDRNEDERFMSTKRNAPRLVVEYIETVVAIIWICLFITSMDRESVILNFPVSILGVLAALLANCVPIGGGIVYVPAFAMLGIKLKLGVAFSISTMSVGNGIFGFLTWLKKDSSLIVLESFPSTVVTSWLGSFIGIFHAHVSDERTLKLFFSGFCVVLGCFVFASAYFGGVAEFMACVSGSKPSSSPPRLTLWSHCLLALVSFFAGLYLVPNIAVGPALTTYILLVLVGYDSKAAMVTGIITGGWVCWLPFCLHAFVLDDIPYQMWVMVIPGVYAGAKAAPLVHDRLGMRTVLYSFGCFLCFTAILFLLH